MSSPVKASSRLMCCCFDTNQSKNVPQQLSEQHRGRQSVRRNDWTVIGRDALYHQTELQLMIAFGVD